MQHEPMAAARTAPVPRPLGRREEIADLIGRTPLLRLPALEPGNGVEIYAKAEWTNPGGSIKDRAALWMIREGERSGALRPGKTLVDATSGNTGIAYAMLGAAFGYRVRVVAPANITRSRLRLLRSYGADVVLTPAAEGMDGAVEAVQEMVRRDPGRLFHPDQYNNAANRLAHYHGTGLEILKQTRGRVTHFVAGLGTTGTFVGSGIRLRQAIPEVRLIGVQPDSPLHALEGLKHLASAGHVPGIFDARLADRYEIVSTEEAQETAFRLARETGVRLGPSGAAAAVAAARVASRLEAGVVVTVFPDDADKYLEEPFWDAGEGIRP